MSLLDKASLIVTPNAYKTSKLYSVVPSTGTGDMDVVRDTTATRVNSLGLIESVGNNIPRIDYSNGSCPSLLVEPQRTNLLTYSNDFSNFVWQKLFSSTITFDSAILNPEGNGSYYFTASNLQFGSILRQTNIFSIGETHTISFFVKKGNYRYVGFRVGNSVNVLRYPTYDFDTDTLNKQGVTCTFNRTILNNGWVKVTLTFTQTDSAVSCDIALVPSDGDISTTLSGGQFVYVYGAQLELGSYPTSYIPTVASTVTRNADIISKTGISSLIGQTEGTLFSEIDLNKSFGSDLIVCSLDTIFSTSIQIRLNRATNIIEGTFYDGSNYIGAISSSSYTSGIVKIAYIYKSGSFKLFINGTLIGTNSNTYSGQTFNSLSINSLWGLEGFIFKTYIKSVQVYKTALTDQECINLTTL